MFNQIFNLSLSFILKDPQFIRNTRAQFSFHQYANFY